MKIPYINMALISEPLNWALIGLIGVIWLLFFHVVMMAFTSMQTGSEASASAPGQIPSPGTNAAGPAPYPMSDPTTIWTDDNEAHFAGDGWLGNP